MGHGVTGCKVGDVMGVVPTSRSGSPNAKKAKNSLANKLRQR